MICSRDCRHWNKTAESTLKNNCCLFGRLFRVKKNGVFLFRISFFVLEIFTFLYYMWWRCIICCAVPLKQHNTQSRITLEILKQCSSNLAPAMYIIKETESHLCCCHGNTLGSSPFLWKTKYPHLQPFKVGQWVLLGAHMVHIPP